jgi:hypothetical protein
MKKHFRNMSCVTVDYVFTDDTKGCGSHFPLPLSDYAKDILISRINDNQIKKITIKKEKL